MCDIGEVFDTIADPVGATLEAVGYEGPTAASVTHEADKAIQSVPVLGQVVDAVANYYTGGIYGAAAAAERQDPTALIGAAGGYGFGQPVLPGGGAGTSALSGMFTPSGGAPTGAGALPIGAEGIPGEIVDPETGVITRAVSPDSFDVPTGTPLAPVPTTFDNITGEPITATETPSPFVGASLNVPPVNVAGQGVINVAPGTLPVADDPNIVPGGIGGGAGDVMMQGTPGVTETNYPDYGGAPEMLDTEREALRAAAAAKAAAAKAAASGGDLNFAQKALKTLGLYDTTKGTFGPTALPLGFLTASQIMANQQGKSLQSQLTAAARPASDVATAQIQRGLSGQIPASTTFDIDKWTKDTKAAIMQRYANMGRDPQNDSAAAYELSQVDAQAVAMRDKAAQDEITLGLNAAGIAQGPTTEAALAGAQQDQQLVNSIGQTLQLLALMQSVQGRNA